MARTAKQKAASRKNLERARAARSRGGKAKKGISGAKKALKGTGALTAEAENAIRGKNAKASREKLSYDTGSTAARGPIRMKMR